MLRNSGRAWGKVDRKRWAAVRRQVLARDGWACRQCGRRGRLEVDHIVPQGRGEFDYNLGNLQSLCRDCHYRKTGNENRRQGPLGAAWAELVDELLAGR